jgi:hypothetical protein
MIVGVSRVRHALGDGATVEQARAVHRLLRDAGLLDSAGRPALVGVAEFAELAGVTPGAICQWKDLPEPIARLKNGRIWDRADVMRYLDERIKDGWSPPPVRGLPEAGSERGVSEAPETRRIPT